MRAMCGLARRLFTVLCVATVVLWARSYWRADILVRDEGKWAVVALSAQGRLHLIVQRLYEDAPSHRREPPPTDSTWKLSSVPAHVAAEWLEWHEDVADEKTDLLIVRVIAARYPLGERRAWMVRYWVPCVLLGLAPLVVTAKRLRRRRRARSGLCPWCGYDLRATPGRCPECGRSSVAP